MAHNKKESGTAFDRTIQKKIRSIKKIIDTKIFSVERSVPCH
jgi:hypothetical protein